VIGPFNIGLLKLLVLFSYHYSALSLVDSIIFGKKFESKLLFNETDFMKNKQEPALQEAEKNDDSN